MTQLRTRVNQDRRHLYNSLRLAAHLTPYTAQRAQQLHRMLFYARECLYSSTRRAVTKTVRSITRAPSASTARAATSVVDTQRNRNTSQPEKMKKTRFQAELAVSGSRRRAGRESGMETFRRLVMYYTAPPQMVHFPEERVKQARYVSAKILVASLTQINRSYSYRKSMRRPYQTSLQYKIQRGIHAIRPSSAHFLP